MKRQYQVREAIALWLRGRSAQSAGSAVGASASSVRRWVRLRVPLAQRRATISRMRTAYAYRLLVPVRGNKPRLPIGTLRMRRMAAHDPGPRPYVKVRHAAGQDAWAPLSHVVWERAHGPVPPGCVVACANGDPRDCRIENLLCLRRADLWAYTQRRHAERYHQVRLANGARARRRMREVYMAHAINCRRRRILAERQAAERAEAKAHGWRAPDDDDEEAAA